MEISFVTKRFIAIAIIHCPASSGNFHENFAKLGLKRLIATCYEDIGLSGVSIYDGGHDKNITCCSYKLMRGDGDFRSEECVELLKQSDHVRTYVATHNLHPVSNSCIHN